MTKNITREQLDEYAEMLGCKFEEGRSVTTAQLHSILRHVFSAFAGSAAWKGIESRRVTEDDLPEVLPPHLRLQDPLGTKQILGADKDIFFFLFLC